MRIDRALQLIWVSVEIFGAIKTRAQETLTPLQCELYETPCFPMMSHMRNLAYLYIVDSIAHVIQSRHMGLPKKAEYHRVSARYRGV
jgi:hypothetical protein